MLDMSFTDFYISKYRSASVWWIEIDGCPMKSFLHKEILNQSAYLLAIDPILKI